MQRESGLEANTARGVVDVGFEDLTEIVQVNQPG